MSSPRLLVGRTSTPGATYVITTVVRGRRDVLGSALAAHAVLDELRLAARQGMAVPVAWAVMPDHLHWMFELGEASLPRLVMQVKSRSSRRLGLLGVVGPVWQPGYYDHQVRHDEDLAAQARYILANPVRRGLAERIGEYPYAWCRHDM